MRSHERVIRAMIQRILAISSPNLTVRMFAGIQALAQLPPLDEVRVRQLLYSCTINAIVYVGHLWQLRPQSPYCHSAYFQE